MSKEQTKAAKRRLSTAPTYWNTIFRGKALDIGCGDDPIDPELWSNITSLTTFDVPGSEADKRGDANKLHDYFEPESFDLIHSSHCLEHMELGPIVVLERWARLLKSGGHMVIVVPDFDLYELSQWPSKFGSGHNWAFSCWRRTSEAVGRMVEMPLLLAMLYTKAGLQTSYNLITTNYDFTDRTIDQTRGEAECCIECVITKP